MRARGTHFTPPSFPSDNKHEDFLRDLYLGVMSEGWDLTRPVERFPSMPRASPSAPLYQVAMPVYTKDPFPAPQLLGTPILEVTHICPGELCPLFFPEQVAMCVCLESSIHTPSLRVHLCVPQRIQEIFKGHRKLPVYPNSLCGGYLVTIYPLSLLPPGCWAGAYHPSHLLIFRQWGQW